MHDPVQFDRLAFENKLRQALNSVVPKHSTLKKAMEYSLLSPGKRIRPQLVYEAASTLGLSDLISDPLAISIEMVHAFSLIHDDLPCMDDDDFRRGLPTNHKVFGEPVALLAGDALLIHALGIFSKLSERVNPIVFSEANQLFMECIGAQGIMQGQALELELFQPTLDHVLNVQNLKTTSLFRASILIPVLLAGFPKSHNTYEEYLRFANAFGFAFQAADDLADASQDTISKNLITFIPPDELKKRAIRQLTDANLTRHFPSAQWLLSQF